VKRLESLVSHVLHFTREINVSVDEKDLAEDVDQALELAHPHAHAKQITLNVHGPRPLCVSADPVLIGQALLNLLLNAIEAMETAGEIDIRWQSPPVESDARQFHLMIRDRGPGIPPHILDRIFNPFFTTKDSGTGLGLAIVHRVVEAHDGTIIASNADDGGAKFEIRI
jgi:signal transduction histidine kinase